MSGNSETNRLFVYGTLQDARVIRAVTGRTFASTAAILPDYRRNRVKDADYPGIVADITAKVGGCLLMDVDCVSLDKLDAFEGEYYQRIEVNVMDLQSRHYACSVYVIAPHWLHLLTNEPWSLEEFQRTGYQRFRDTYPNF